MSANKLWVSMFTALLFGVFTLGSAAAQSLVEDGARAEVVTQGYAFTEGPYWHPEGYLLFSDIPGNTIYRWHPDSSEVSVFLQPSGNSNGIEMGTDGRVLIAQHAGTFSAVNENGTLDTLASEYKGKRLNSPNDIALRSDGSIYFTDPPYGVNEENRELSYSGVYRITPDGRLELLYDELDRPNGITFSPDEKTLYVSNTTDGRILAFDVTTNGNVSLPHQFASVGRADSTGAADGIVTDKKGRLYATGPGGLYVFSPEGKRIEKIELPARTTNLAWGREDRRELFLTTPSAIYRLPMTSEQ